MEVEHSLKRKTQQHQDESDSSKLAKVDEDFDSREDVDKENEPVLNAGVSIKVKSFDDALNENDDDGDDSDSERGPNPEDIVLNMDSLRKYQQVIDPEFDLNEIESRARLDSQAAYDRAMVARAQQRRLPGKVANVTQSRPTLTVTHSGGYNRSQSYAGRQLSHSPMLDLEEQRMALTPDERQRQIISKLKEQSSNPLAGLARALKQGPRRSFGKSRHTEGDPTPPKAAPVTKPKPKPASKQSSDGKEEKSGGFLFRRRSFNDKKSSAADDDSYKGSPKVSKKFVLKLGGSGGKKPPVKSKPVFSTTSTGESDSILSEDIPQSNSTTSTPSNTISALSKTFESRSAGSPGAQKTSTPYKSDATPPSRRERTPNERESSLFKDPPPLFGHRSVLFGSAEFDAIFDKYSKEDDDEAAKAEPTEDSSETQQQFDKKPTPDRKPTPSKKPDISSKPNWTGRGSTSSDKAPEQKSSRSRVSEGKALFERPTSAEEAQKKNSGRRGFGGAFSKYEDNSRKFETKKEEDKTTDEESKPKEEVKKNDEVKEIEKVKETKEDKKMEVSKDESHASSNKVSLFDDEAMETDEIAVETKVDKKKSLFDKYEAESVTPKLFKDVADEDKLFGDDKDTKVAPPATKKTVYESLFSTEEKSSGKLKSGSLFDEEPSDGDDDELFSTTKKPQKKDDGLKVGDKESQEAKISSPLMEDDDDPLFGKPKSPVKSKLPVADLFSKEKEEKDKESVEDDVLMDVDKDKTETKVKNEKKDDSPGLFDEPTSSLFDDKPETQRSTSIFEGKRSKSEEELFSIGQKGKESEVVDVKETDVAGGYLLLEKKDETTRSSLFDDDKLVFDDSDVLPKLEKESKEMKGQFQIDDFVMVPTQVEITATKSVAVEDTTVDPLLSDEKKESNNEVALEDFPPKQLPMEDESQEDTSKESGKERESDAAPVDSDRLRIRREGSAGKKKSTPPKDENKSSADDKPAWMVEAQRRKERRLLEKEKEKEKKQLGAKEKSPTTKRNTTEQSKPPLADVKLKKSNISATTSVAKKQPVVEDDMPEWQKKLMERKQRVAEQKKALSSKETTYTSRRERSKDTTTTTSTVANGSPVVDKKEDDNMEEKEQKEIEEKKEDNKVEEQEQKEVEEEQPKSKITDEEMEKSKSPPLQEKPLLSPKPKLDEDKSPTRTSAKPELKKKPSVEVIISSTRRETRRYSADQEKEKDKDNEGLTKEPENGTEKVSPSSKRRAASTSDKKTVSVTSKVSTSVTNTKNGSTSSDSSLPKWKRDLQKKTEPEKKDKGSRDTVTSPTPQDSLPEWKRQLLEKRRQRRTPTPTDDKEVPPPSSSKTDKPSTDKPNYRSMLTTRATPVTTAVSPKPSRRNASNVNKEVPEFMKEFKSKGRSVRDSKS